MLRILVADDHEIVRRGLRALLDAHADWQVCAEAVTGREAIEKVSQLKPDVIVMDISMPEMNGLDATREILKFAPRTEVLILTMHESEQVVREVLEAGARGYVLKTDAGRSLVAAVESLARMGLGRYEISNFARPGSESAHNLKYWRLEPYAGFGADAHSFDGTIRLQNVETVAEYVERFSKGESPLAASVPAIPAEERFFVGLRLAEGIRPLADEWDRFDVPIRRFIKDRLLERDGETLRLTPRGILLSNEVFREFIHL